MAPPIFRIPQEGGSQDTWTRAQSPQMDPQQRSEWHVALRQRHADRIEAIRSEFRTRNRSTPQDLMDHLEAESQLFDYTLQLIRDYSTEPERIVAGIQVREYLENLPPPLPTRIPSPISNAAVAPHQPPATRSQTPRQQNTSEERPSRVEDILDPSTNQDSQVDNYELLRQALQRAAVAQESPQNVQGRGLEHEFGNDDLLPFAPQFEEIERQRAEIRSAQNVNNSDRRWRPANTTEIFEDNAGLPQMTSMIGDFSAHRTQNTLDPNLMTIRGPSSRQEESQSSNTNQMSQHMREFMTRLARQESQSTAPPILAHNRRVQPLFATVGHPPRTVPSPLAQTSPQEDEEPDSPRMRRTTYNWRPSIRSTSPSRHIPEGPVPVIHVPPTIDERVPFNIANNRQGNIPFDTQHLLPPTIPPLDPSTILRPEQALSSPSRTSPTVAAPSPPQRLAPVEPARRSNIMALLNDDEPPNRHRGLRPTRSMEQTPPRDEQQAGQNRHPSPPPAPAPENRTTFARLPNTLHDDAMFDAIDVGDEDEFERMFPINLSPARPSHSPTPSLPPTNLAVPSFIDLPRDITSEPIRPSDSTTSMLYNEYLIASRPGPSMILPEQISSTNAAEDLNNSDSNTIPTLVTPSPSSASTILPETPSPRRQELVARYYTLVPEYSRSIHRHALTLYNSTTQAQRPYLPHISTLRPISAHFQTPCLARHSEGIDLLVSFIYSWRDQSPGIPYAGLDSEIEGFLKLLMEEEMEAERDLWYEVVQLHVDVDVDLEAWRKEEEEGEYGVSEEEDGEEEMEELVIGRFMSIPEPVGTQTQTQNRIQDQEGSAPATASQAALAQAPATQASLDLNDPNDLNGGSYDLLTSFNWTYFPSTDTDNSGSSNFGTDGARD
ncbi:hypothetical protein BDZ45DRAFT_805273 [Acephala macrosclerotiorum]|nr:hypothetical protein BDZ45DRAFT_805273 [Acephala macrosclerotiorum]